MAPGGAPMGWDVKPSPAEIQVHDLVLDSDPDTHPADCAICKERTPASTDLAEDPVPEPTIADLQAQLDQLNSDLAARDQTIADLRNEVASKDSATELASAQQAAADAKTAQENAEAALDALRTEYETFKSDLQALTDADVEKARKAQLATDRAAAVKALGYGDTFVTEKRAADWAELDDAAWDLRLAELTETKPKVADSKDPVDPKTPLLPTDTVLNPEQQEPVLDADGNPVVTDADTPTFKDFLRKRDVVAKV